MVDIARTQRRKPYRLIAGIAAVTLSAVIAWAATRPEVPAVDRDSLWIDTVRRGAMVRETAGSGKLVPEESRWISSVTAGVVERIAVEPGMQVAAGALLVELTAPEQTQAAGEAEWRLRAAEAELERERARVRGEVLAQEVVVAQIAESAEQAKIHAEADKALAAEGLASAITAKLSRRTTAGLVERLRLESERLRALRTSTDAAVRAQQAAVEQLRAVAALQRRRVEGLQIRADVSGVLQELSVEIGQAIEPGKIVAKIVRPDRLKAQIRVPEAEAGGVRVGQKARVDTGNGEAGGVVVRIDPAALDGTVAVDIRFTGGTPAGLRPDANVSAAIELARLANVLYVRRPVRAAENGTIELFRVDGDGARRTPVLTGRASAETIEIRGGLAVGDRVILSDTSNWPRAEAVRFR